MNLSSPSLRSNITGGCISGLIYIIIALASGNSVLSSLGFGVLLGLAVAAFAFLVSQTVIAVKRRRAGSW